MLEICTITWVLAPVSKIYYPVPKSGNHYPVSTTAIYIFLFLYQFIVWISAQNSLCLHFSILWNIKASNNGDKAEREKKKVSISIVRNHHEREILKWSPYLNQTTDVGSNLGHMAQSLTYSQDHFGAEQLDAHHILIWVMSIWCNMATVLWHLPMTAADVARLHFTLLLALLETKVHYKQMEQLPSIS